MTLSARYSTDCGIVRPICLAAFRLTMNSNFVGCSTGRSAGFVPFKILSTYVAARRCMSGARAAGLREKGHAGRPGDGFHAQPQPLPAEPGGDSAVAGDIPPGARKTRNYPGPDRIAAYRHDDRDRLSLSFDRRNRYICG